MKNRYKIALFDLQNNECSSILSSIPVVASVVDSYVPNPYPKLSITLDYGTNKSLSGLGVAKKKCRIAQKKIFQIIFNDIFHNILIKLHRMSTRKSHQTPIYSHISIPKTIQVYSTNSHGNLII
jgi:hypothetical protein